MTLDDTLLAEVEAARARLEDLEDGIYEARAAFHQSVRRLHAAGASMREIATALAMSHQRVHQIIGEEGIVEVETSATDVTRHPASQATDTDTGAADREDACSFCRTPRRQLEKLFGAPGRVFVCDACLLRAQSQTQSFDVAVECTFCRRRASNGFEDGGTFICDDCISTCARIMQQADDQPKRTAMRRRSGVLRCSFCNASTAQVKKLIAGPGVYICGLCVDAAQGVASTGQAAPGPRQVGLRRAVREPHPCGFCGKRTPTVDTIVKGGRTRICNECIDLCVEIIERENAPA